MELKYKAWIYLRAHNECSNRTFMELKLLYNGESM